VRAVAEQVIVGAIYRVKVLYKCGTAFELWMCSVDSSVDDVSACPRTSGGVI
jgi:hypothetical protein